MDVKSLVPWSRGRGVKAGTAFNPWLGLQQEIDRLFDDFLPTAAGGAAVAAGWPQLDVVDAGAEVKVTAELPGLDQKDIEITLEDGVLVIKGEKKTESEGPGYRERWQGQFRRSVQLGPDIDPDKIAATFQNGVLALTIAKKPEAERTARRITING